MLVTTPHFAEVHDGRWHRVRGSSEMQVVGFVRTAKKFCTSSEHYEYAACQAIRPLTHFMQRTFYSKDCVPAESGPPRRQPLA